MTNNIKHFQVEHWIVQSNLIHVTNERLINEFAALTSIEYFQSNEIVIKQHDISDNFYLIIEGIVEVAQETNDFMYYDFFMKSEFLENQILVNQERKKKAIKRSLSKRRTGTIADDIK